MGAVYTAGRGPRCLRQAKGAVSRRYLIGAKLRHQHRYNFLLMADLQRTVRQPCAQDLKRKAGGQELSSACQLAGPVNGNMKNR